MEQPQSSSLIKISERDVDILQYEQGLRILDEVNMGAFVHGIEDEFYEVRAHSLNALAHFCCGSARVRAAIIEVMINLVNDDSKHVRLNAVHALIYVAQQYGLQINDNDLQTVQGTLEDGDRSIQDAGKTLLAGIQLSSVDSFKSTIESLIKYMQRSQQEDVRHALYRLGRAHSTYVHALAKDLLKEFKGCLLGEAGLDAPECGCILLLFMAASECNTNTVSLVPSHALSPVRLVRQSISQKSVILKANSNAFQVEMLRRLEAGSVTSKRHINTDSALSVDSEHRRKVHDFLGYTAQSSWNVKDLLLSGMMSTARQILSGCKRDLKKLLNDLDDEDQVALGTYVLHYVECIDFVSQGWTCFQQKGRRAATTRLSLPDLACRLEVVVRCMQHTYIGHSSEQKLDLLELSTIPVLWRMTVGNHYGEPEAAVKFIKKTIGVGSSHTLFLETIKKELFEAGGLPNAINARNVVRELVSTFWPRLPTINYVQMLKAALSIPGNDMEHPTQFVPSMPIGITVSIFTRNLENRRVWVRMHVDSVWTQFTFLDAEDYKRVNPFITNLQIHGVSNVSKCIIKAAVVLECPGLSYECNKRGPKAFVLPLTSEKMIYLQHSSNTRH